MDAVLSADIPCETISLEKRHFDPVEREFSVYFWIDDIYACMFGHKFNRTLLRHASIGRYDLQLWCERRNIPLPEFWFPLGWNLEYELPEDEIRPGHYYIRKDWTEEQWAEWRKERGEIEREGACEGSSADTLPGSDGELSSVAEDNILDATEKREVAIKKLRPNQEIAVACRQIAKAMWKEDPNRFYPSIIQDELIQKYGGAASYDDDTVRGWIKAVAPPNIRNHRGRPPKNGGQDE